MSAGPRSREFWLTADWGVVEVDGRATLTSRPHIRVDAQGRIAEILSGSDGSSDELARFDLGRQLLLPGFVNAHSHAFQRTIRGATGRRGRGDPSSFWSWREAMYGAANRLDPDEFEIVTRQCFAEMLAAGITCVGEFHYLHHSPQGRPYDDANELSNRVIAAAAAVGIRLALLEVYYERAGAGEPALSEQRRFCDGSVEHYARRLDDLRAAVERDASPGVWIGVAPHSARAVGRESLNELVAYANAGGLPIHAHVSEQPRENEAVAAEHGMSPTQLFAEAGALERSRAFTAVHAIHLIDRDHELLADQNVCACPTTEADLGDGTIPASRHHEAGTTLCLGSDSNSVIDLIQEARALEMHERLARQRRLCLADEHGEVAPTLLAAATRGGGLALGRPDLGRLAPGCPFDAVSIDLDHRCLREVSPELCLDAVMLSGSAAPVSQVWIDGVRRR